MIIISQTCRKEQFNCLDGTCLPDSNLCDGTRDCNSGLDELVCTTIICPTGQFACGRECVELRRMCDGVRDCSGGEDEQMCRKWLCCCYQKSIILWAPAAI